MVGNTGAAFGGEGEGICTEPVGPWSPFLFPLLAEGASNSQKGSGGGSDGSDVFSGLGAGAT